MDIRRMLLLIGLAVVTHACFSSDRSKRESFPKITQHEINPDSTLQQTAKPHLYHNGYNYPKSTENNIQEPLKPESTPHSYKDINVDSKISKDIALNVLALSQELVRRKLESSTAKYEVLSPISITSALQLAFLGARGRTYEELKILLKYSSDYSLKELHRQFGEIIKDLKTNEANQQREDTNWKKSIDSEYIGKYLRNDPNPNYDEHRIEMANGIFVSRDTSLRQQYKNVAASVYQSEVKALDFLSQPEQSSQFINDWVNTKTHGKIKEIVPKSISPNTKAVLANALYFKAEWQTSFIDRATMKKPFYPDGRDKSDSSVFVNMMAHGGRFPHFYDNVSDVDVLGLPYKQNSTTMYIILPRNSNRNKIREVQADLTSEKLESLIEQMTLKTTILLFPKMHLSSTHMLAPDLQDMGARSLFSPSESDLSLMTDQREFTKPKYEQAIAFPDPLTRGKRNVVSFKTPSEDKTRQQKLDFKDFLLNKRIVKSDGTDKKKRRSKRDVVDDLENLREFKPLANPRLYADEVVHKVDLEINEKGTEGGAATAITLNRSGTSVLLRVETPFLFLIRHDPTKIPLFYGAVFEPPYEEESTQAPEHQHEKHSHSHGRPQN